MMFVKSVALFTLVVSALPVLSLPIVVNPQEGPSKLPSAPHITARDGAQLSKRVVPRSPDDPAVVSPVGSPSPTPIWSGPAVLDPKPIIHREDPPAPPRAIPRSPDEDVPPTPPTTASSDGSGVWSGPAVLDPKPIIHRRAKAALLDTALGTLLGKVKSSAENPNVHLQETGPGKREPQDPSPTTAASTPGATNIWSGPADSKIQPLIHRSDSQAPSDPKETLGAIRPMIRQAAGHVKRVMDLGCMGPADKLPERCSSPNPAPTDRLKLASDTILNEVRNNKEVLHAAREFVEKLKRTIEERSKE